MTGECILIVDDNEMNMKLLRWLLEKHGYVVQTAFDAQTAREGIRAAHPQLVLFSRWQAAALPPRCSSLQATWSRCPSPAPSSSRPERTAT